MPPQVPAGVNIDDLPLAPPPPGVVPDFAHPQSRSYQTFVVAGIFIALSLSFTITRIYAKFVVIKSRTWDDCMSLFLRIGPGFFNNLSLDVGVAGMVRYFLYCMAISQRLCTDVCNCLHQCIDIS